MKPLPEWRSPVGRLVRVHRQHSGDIGVGRKLSRAKVSTGFAGIKHYSYSYLGGGWRICQRKRADGVTFCARAASNG